MPSTAVTETYPESALSAEAEQVYHDNNVELPMKLPEGNVYGSSSGSSASFARGYGAAAIATTTLTATQVDHVVRNPVDVIEDGGNKYIIGELPNGELAVVWLVGGAIAYASATATIHCNGGGGTIDVNLVKKIEDLAAGDGDATDVVEIVDGVLTNNRGDCVDTSDHTRQPDATGGEVTYFNVEKGQSILVESGGQNILIDSGSTKTSAFEGELEDAIVEEVNDDGMGGGDDVTIHKLIITHGHEDYISYVDDVIEDDDISVREVYWNEIVDTSSGISQEVLETIEDSDAEYHENLELESGAGDEIEITGTDIEIANPGSADDSTNPTVSQSR